MLLLTSYHDKSQSVLSFLTACFEEMASIVYDFTAQARQKPAQPGQITDAFSTVDYPRQNPGLLRSMIAGLLMNEMTS